MPAVDADVSDQLRFRILSGNNANLVHLNESTGHLTLSPLLNTNVPKLAAMEVSRAALTSPYPKAAAMGTIGEIQQLRAGRIERDPIVEN